MADLSGVTLGPYRVMKRIGRGGMATVYQAYQPAMDRYVAVKVLPEELAADPNFLARFEREAKVVANLQHTNILPVFDYGQERDISYLVMPYIATGTLSEYMAGMTLSLEETARLFGQIADAVDYAHRRGILHRDLKPSNVLMDDSGNALLTDFGLTRMVESTSNLTGTGVIGTPAYMSPEQGQGLPLDARSDIYSLGVILYEMLVGEVPFSAETPVAVIFKHISEPLPMPRSRRADLPENVERVILKGLAKAPEDRFQTAAIMAQTLRDNVRQASGDQRETRPGQAGRVMPDEAETAVDGAINAPLDELTVTPIDLPAKLSAAPDSLPDDKTVAPAVGGTPQPPRKRKRAFLALLALVFVALIVGLASWQGRQTAYRYTRETATAQHIQTADAQTAAAYQSAALTLSARPSATITAAPPGGITNTPYNEEEAYTGQLTRTWTYTPAPTLTATELSSPEYGGTQVALLATNEAIYLLATQTRAAINMQTASATSTATPSATNTGTPATPIMQAGRQLAARGGPGSQYPIVATLDAHAQVTITGLSLDGAWYQVLLPDGSLVWVTTAQTFVQAYGDLGAIPVALAPTVTASYTPSLTPSLTNTVVPTATPTPDVLRIALLPSGLVEDGMFSQQAWEGIQAVAEGLNAETNYFLVEDPDAYLPTIEGLVADGFDIIVANLWMQEALVEAAERFPDVYFIGIDQTFEASLPNLTSLLFHEDQAGYLAGVLAANLTRSDKVAGVYGPDAVPAVVRFAEGFAAGAQTTNPAVEVWTTYHPGAFDIAFNDMEWGAATAGEAIDQGADVIFAAAGWTGWGALRETANRTSEEHPLFCIGVDYDQWVTIPEARACLVTSAMKDITTGLADLIPLVVAGEAPGEFYGPVRLAPFYDFWGDFIPLELADELDALREQLRVDGALPELDRSAANVPLDPAFLEAPANFAQVTNEYRGLTIVTVGDEDAPPVQALPVEDLENIIPAWSPDGTQIIFSAIEPGEAMNTGNDLYLIAADGSDLRPFTVPVNDNNNVAPTWSPDGQWIAFHSSGDIQIVAVTAPDSGVSWVNDNWGYSLPQWSPDSNWLAIYSKEAPPTDYSEQQFPLTVQVLRLSRDGTTAEVVVEMVHENAECLTDELAFSPDGDYIAYRDANCQPMLVPVTGGDPIPLDGFPGWWTGVIFPQWGGLAADAVADGAVEPAEQAPAEQAPADIQPAEIGALYLDGQTGQAMIPYQGDLDARESLTLEAWVRPDSFPPGCGPWGGLCNAAPIISQGYADSTAGNFTLAVGAEQIMFGFEPHDSRFVVPAAVPLGEWTHIAVTHTYGQGADTQIYMNGEALAGGTWVDDGGEPVAAYGDEFPPTNSDEPYHVGSYGSAPEAANFRWHGLIDELRIWHRVRQPEEIQGGMTLELDPAVERGLIAYWTFNVQPGSLELPDSTEGGKVLLLDGGAEIIPEQAPVEQVSTEQPAAAIDPAFLEHPARVLYLQEGEDRIMIERIQADTFSTTESLPVTGFWRIEAAWSYDGEQIIFSALEKGETDDDGYGTTLYIVNPDGSNLRELPVPDAQANNISPVWSPDGEWIAYHSSGGTQIMAVDDPAQGILWMQDDVGLVPPQWSPDSEWLVVYAEQSPAAPGDESRFPLVADVLLLSRDGNEARQLTQIIHEAEDEHCINFHEIAFSPDGAFVAYWDAGCQVMLIPVAGGDPIPLDEFPYWWMGNAYPQWGFAPVEPPVEAPSEESAAASNTAGSPMLIIDSQLTLRAGPGADFSAAATVAPGEYPILGMVPMDERVYYLLDIGDGAEAWGWEMYSAHVAGNPDAIPEIAALESPDTLNIRSTLILRREPSFSSAQLGEVGPGQYPLLDVYVDEDEHTFYQIGLGVVEGWVWSMFSASPVDDLAAGSEAETAADPCLANISANVNLRSGPGTDYTVEAVLRAAATFEVIAQQTSEDGFGIWWQLDNGFWASNSVVQTEGDCASILE